MLWYSVILVELLVASLEFLEFQILTIVVGLRNCFFGTLVGVSRNLDKISYESTKIAEFLMELLYFIQFVEI